jgi:glycosyltransferase involved in cell wall biosynthesis
VSQQRVSVVVSSHERPVPLGRLLQALREQTLPAAAFEVIVVDNGSGPETGRVLARELDAGVLTLRTVRHERTLGPAGGRNSGWRLARAGLVAFTDDDCRPAPEWLAELLAAAAEHPRAILQGATEPEAVAEGPRRAVRERTVTVRGPGPQLETCNIAYPLELLEELGGFDERYGPRPAGEDTDLGWRALERGREARFVPGALVHHAVVRLGLRDALADAGRWGAGARVLASHPGARAMLYRGVFWNVWHYLLLRSALSLLAPAWLRRLLLARHALALRGRARELGAGALAAPALLCCDAVETAAVARGAIRYRTLVL